MVVNLNNIGGGTDNCNVNGLIILHALTECTCARIFHNKLNFLCINDH